MMRNAKKFIPSLLVECDGPSIISRYELETSERIMDDHHDDASLKIFVCYVFAAAHSLQYVRIKPEIV